MQSNDIVIQKPENLPSLTGLRFVAAICVVIAHSGMIVPKVLLPRYLWLGSHLVFFGMTLFFVLSGFVITYNYFDSFRSKSLRVALYDFLSARAARLLPLYFFVLIVTLATLPLAIRWEKQAFLFPLYLTPAHSSLFWLNDNKPPEVFTYFGIAWSIATEWVFYLCFPLIVPLLVRLRGLPSVLVCGGACIVAAIFLHYCLDRDQGRHFTFFLVAKGSALNELHFPQKS